MIKNNYTPDFILSFQTKIAQDIGDEFKSTISKLQKDILEIEMINSINGENDNKWRNTKNEVIGQKRKKKEFNAKNEIYMHLNKLSDSNIKTIAFQINKIILDYPDDKQNLVEEIITKVFQSAQIQVSFCHLYANLFNFLNKDIINFKTILEQKINLEIKKIENINENLDLQDYNEYCDCINIKDNYIGCFQFIIELYNNNIISLGNMKNLITQLLSYLDNEEKIYKLEIITESLCRIISTLKNINRITKDDRDDILKTIKDKYNFNKNKLNMRSQCIIENILDN